MTSAATTTTTHAPPLSTAPAVTHARGRRILRPRGRMAYREKIRRHQRCPADQAPVNVGHREQISGIARLDASSVENRQIAGDTGVTPCNPRAHERVHVL